MQVKITRKVQLIQLKQMGSNSFSLIYSVNVAEFYIKWIKLQLWSNFKEDKSLFSLVQFSCSLINTVNIDSVHLLYVAKFYIREIYSLSIVKQLFRKQLCHYITQFISMLF